MSWQKVLSRFMPAASAIEVEESPPPVNPPLPSRFLRAVFFIVIVLMFVLILRFFGL